jgi:hypothetical protein
MTINITMRKWMDKVLNLLCVLLLAAVTGAGATTDHGAKVTSVTIEIAHRMHPDFHETIRTKMNTREPIGDTDLFFEVVEFYPHFAILDSSKTIVSLSDEPTNAAFKIRIYEKDTATEDAWAFFSIKVPHYSRTAFLSFDVVEFEYGDRKYGANEEKETE